MDQIREPVQPETQSGVSGHASGLSTPESSNPLRLPGIVTSTGLALPDDLSFDQWKQVGDCLLQMEHAVQWMIGDWLRFGESRYGGKYVEAERMTGLAYGTLANIKQVADRFDFSRRRENVPWSFHAEVAALPPEQADALLDQAESEGLSRTKFRAAANRARNAPQLQPGTETCTVEDLWALVSAGKRFSTLYVDPPWAYGNDGLRGCASDHYSTMSVEHLCALPVKDLAAENSHLHLWTTTHFYVEAVRVMEAWGFRHVSDHVWTKPRMGTGQYWRTAHEYLLLGVRGSLPFGDHAQISWLQIDRGEHSAKPEEIRTKIELVSPPPYLELFARKSVEGWTCWGDQVARAQIETVVGANAATPDDEAVAACGEQASAPPSGVEGASW